MKAIVFGSGKIARGFIGHLLYNSGIQFVLLDVNPALVSLLNERKRYTVHVMGNPEQSVVVEGFEAGVLQELENISIKWFDSQIGFISVGGKNLPALAGVLAECFKIGYLKQRVDKPVFLITCENWKNPAALLRKEIRSRLSGNCLKAFDRWVGIAESVVMRSGVEPTEEMLRQDPLCVQVSDYWELPVDRDAFEFEPPSMNGIDYRRNFAGFLERKFYTYNAANGTVSYLGYLRGHTRLFDAATDSEIVSVLAGVYEETSAALVNKHHTSEAEQRAFAASSRKKLQDPNIADYVERNARDPIRKLGPDDRLVGSARLVQQYGGTPEHLAIAIAAAIHYDHPEDPIAQELKRIRLTEGIDFILQSICSLLPDDPLFRLVKEKVDVLKQKGWIV